MTILACAANVGWELVDAPLYMKRDNATAMARRHWLRDLLALWRHGRQPSTLGGAFNREMLRRHPGGMVTPGGELGCCADNLPGQAVFIPRAVADTLGFWNEEYGLHGGEDGDYGLRMRGAAAVVSARFRAHLLHFSLNQEERALMDALLP